MQARSSRAMIMLVFCPKCALLYAVASAYGKILFYIESAVSII